MSKFKVTRRENVKIVFLLRGCMTVIIFNYLSMMTAACSIINHFYVDLYQTSRQFSSIRLSRRNVFQLRLEFEF